MEDINSKVQFLIDYFKDKELIKTELDYTNEYEFLIAVVLSAQCLDRRINIVTPHLFQKYHNFKSLANADKKDVYEIIKSISFAEMKSERIISIAKVITDQYNGIMPKDFCVFTKIKGIGRKSANLILATLYDYPGIAVDTHVGRVAFRLGLTSSKNPDIAEKDLMQAFPQKYWNKINPWLVIFGRYHCKAIKPECKNCGLKKICCSKDF